jgi:cation transport regulator ChaB
MQLHERLPANAPKAMIDMWEKIYKNAKEQYGDEGKAAATAWAAVKNKYKKSADGKWVAKESIEPNVLKTVECVDPNIGNLLYSEQAIKKLING